MTMRARRIPIPALACALVLALAFGGCGGGEATSAPVVSKTTFLAKMEAACTRAYNEIKKEFHAFVKGSKAKPFSTPAELEEYAETVIVPIRKRQLEEMRAIGAPKGEEDRVEAIYAAYDDGIHKTEEDPEEAISSLYGVFGEAEELTQGYGLQNCR